MIAEAVESTVRTITFASWVERWHDFYILAGTAAVTLAGLLFVALSLHIDQLVEPSHEHLLALSRATLTSFVSVLMASLFMLVPPLGARPVGVFLTLLAVMGIVVTVVYARGAQHHEEAGFSRRQMRRRLLFPILGYLLMLTGGVGVYLRIPEMLYQMIGAIGMILGNAAGTAWELLVTVAKQKRARQRA